jgi:hypothetical protein
MINNIDAGSYYKLSHREFRKHYNIVIIHDKIQGLAYILKKGIWSVYKR